MIKHRIVCLAVAVLAVQPHGARAQTSLSGRINQIVSGDNAAAYWGISVRDLVTGATLYERNANALFIPASNLKLVVTATASGLLGESYR
jgi:D-alanyl-D-alanine carboxypeptidase/D-alanyl-D-alanine-endopeptidase (penicillin-binding protein 4)